MRDIKEIEKAIEAIVDRRIRREREVCARILERVARCYADPEREKRCRYAARVVRGRQDPQIREKIEEEMKDADWVY